MTKKSNVHRLVLLDKEMNRIWDKEVTLPFSYFFMSGAFERFETNTTIALDNEGSVYFAGRIYSSNTDFDYQILKYDGEKFSQNFKLPMTGLNYHNCQINFDRNNKLFAVGFYSEGEKKVGGYYFTLDKNMNQAQNLSFSEMKLEHLYQTHIPNQKRNKKKSVDEILEEFGFYSAVYGANGDIVMGAEGSVNLSTRETQTWSANGGVSIDRAYHEGSTDTYVFRINPENGITWLKRMPKKQKSTDRDGGYANYSGRMGCEFFVEDDNVIVLFNDHPKNVGLDENATNVLLAWNLNVKPMTVIIDKNGNQNRQLLSVPEKFNLIPEFSNAYFVANNKMLITARYKTKSKLGIITVGE